MARAETGRRALAWGAATAVAFAMGTAGADRASAQILGGDGGRRTPVEVSFFSGGSATRASDLRIVQPSLGTDATFRSVDWSGRPFQGSVFYGYRVGAFPFRKNRRLGVALDFLHFKTYAKVNESAPVAGTWQGQPVDTVAPISDRVQEFRITNGVNVITLAAMYRVPVAVSEAYPDGRVQPYVGGGPSYSLLWPANQVDRRGNLRRARHFDLGGWGYTLQAGVRYALTPAIAIFAEGRYNRVDAAVKVIDGRGDTDLRTRHAIGGFTVSF